MADVQTVYGSRRFSEPLRCALLFCIAASGEDDAALLEVLGGTREELKKFKEDYARELTEMHNLSRLGELCQRELLARLIRGRLAEQLVASSKASELAVLTRAASRLPAWILGEAEKGLEPPPAKPRAAAA